MIEVPAGAVDRSYAYYTSGRVCFRALPRAGPSLPNGLCIRTEYSAVSVSPAVSVEEDEAL